MTQSLEKDLHNNRQNSLIVSNINTNTNPSIIFRFHDKKSWKRLLHSYRQNSFTASETNTNTNHSMPFRKFYDIKSWRRFMHSNCQNSPAASKTTQACFPTNIIQHTLLLRLHLDQIFPLLFSITSTNINSRYINLLVLYCFKAFIRHWISAFVFSSLNIDFSISIKARIGSLTPTISNNKVSASCQWYFQISFHQPESSYSSTVNDMSSTKLLSQSRQMFSSKYSNDLASISINPSSEQNIMSVRHDGK